MSAGGPESIPTSADRRSKRPVKKRALTPVSAQAATVDALFAKPDQEIRIPDSATDSGSALVARRAAGGAPPEIISNVQGSSSGAGSGEFHVYKASRRREYARLRQLDEEARRDREKTEFEAARAEREARDDDKTKRNREKRERAKARKAKLKKGEAKGAEAKESEAKRPEVKEADSAAGTAASPDVSVNNPPTANGGGSKPAVVPAPPATFDGPGLLIQDDDD